MICGLHGSRRLMHSRICAHMLAGICWHAVIMAGYVCKHVAAGRVSVRAGTSELSTEAPDHWERDRERNKTAGIITALSKQKCSREDCQQPSVRYRKTQIIRTLSLEERVMTFLTPGLCAGQEEGGSLRMYTVWQSNRGYELLLHCQNSFWRMWVGERN